VQQFYELTKIRCVFTIPNSKQENAIVERANREVMRHLRAIVYDERVLREWSSHVPFAQRIMNSMVHSSTGLKPCEIVFGREFSQEFITSASGEESQVSVIRVLKSSPETVNDESNESIGVVDDEVGEDEWLSEIKRAQRVAIEAARDNLISKDVQHMLKAPKSIN